MAFHQSVSGCRCGYSSQATRSLAPPLVTISLCAKFIVSGNNNKPCFISVDTVTILSLRTALFWAITQRVMIIPYGRFGTTHRSHFQVSRIQVLPLHAARQPRRAQFSTSSQRKPGTTQNAEFTKRRHEFSIPAFRSGAAGSVHISVYDNSDVL